MRLSERLSETIFRLIAPPFLRIFSDRNPERILKRSLKILDPLAIDSIRDYVKGAITPSGGFPDKAGRPDLYYTLFGFFISNVLNEPLLIRATAGYVEKEAALNNIRGVHLYCAAILTAHPSCDRERLQPAGRMIRKQLRSASLTQTSYSAFLNLMTCYYLNDYNRMFLISRQLEKIVNKRPLPSTVIAASIVVKRCFREPADDLIRELLSFYSDGGGFKATLAAPVPDLLSTAVALYALGFAGFDLRTIKPDCLEFIDSLFSDGGFGGNIIDSEPDIEYTFYGLLALGSLTGIDE